jgi:hypothetical protein
LAIHELLGLNGHLRILLLGSVNRLLCIELDLRALVLGLNDLDGERLSGRIAAAIDFLEGLLLDELNPDGEPVADNVLRRPWGFPGFSKAPRRYAFENFWRCFGTVVFVSVLGCCFLRTGRLGYN